MPILPKKKGAKMANFGPKAWTIFPLEKFEFFKILNFLFSFPRKAFSVPEYHKTHSLGLYCLKRKCGKMANFGPKQLINLFGKM